MGLWDELGSDANIETDGALMDFGDNRLWLARAGGANEAYTQFIQKRTMAESRKHPNRNIPIPVIEQITMEGVARHVVKKLWCEQHGDGYLYIPELGKAYEKIAHDPKSMINLFKTFKELWMRVQDFCSELQNYRVEEEEDAVGNLPTSSTSTGSELADTPPKSSRRQKSEELNLHPKSQAAQS